MRSLSVFVCSGHATGVRLVLVAMGLVLALGDPAGATSHSIKALGLQMPSEQVEAPDFSLPDLTGKKIRLKDFRGMDGSVAHTYSVRPVPATYLIRRDGKILGRAFGAREWDSSEARKYFASVLADGKR